MNRHGESDHVSKKRVVYTITGMEGARALKDQTYRTTDGGSLGMDLYYPNDSAPTPRPAVVLVTGFPDKGMRQMVGCAPKEMGSYISWAQLIAASGMVAITYANEHPATDVDAVVQHVRENAGALKVDDNRMAVWACSGNVPNALSMLIRGARDRFRCAALCYGYMLDFEGSRQVANAAARFGFVNPCAGTSMDVLPTDIPLFIARAGRDQMPGLNEALDRFVIEGLTRNLPITLVNHSAAPHAFDLFDDSETSREIIRQILRFLRCYLVAEP